MQGVVIMKVEMDLIGEVCPYTFVKTKLKLEELEIGDILEVTVDHEPATNNVPRSLQSEGQEVLGVEDIADGVWKIIVKKAAEL